MKKTKIENNTGSNASKKTDSFLAKGTIMTGTLKFPGNLTYHGHFKGKIVSDGKLIVGETGEIDSEISVAVALNAGEIRGSIIASERVQILPYGRIDGSVKTPDLQIESGAVFNGKSEMPDIPRQVLSAESREETVVQKRKKVSSPQTAKEPVTNPLPGRKKKAAGNRAVFSLVSIVAAVSLFYGAGFIREYFFTAPAPEKIKNISPPEKSRPADEKMTRHKTGAPSALTRSTEKQAPPKRSNPVTAAESRPRKSKTDKTSATEKRTRAGKKTRLTETYPLAKEKIKHVKKKTTVKSRVQGETKSSIMKVIKKQPVDLAALKTLATHQISDGKNKKAIDTLKKILEISPSDSAANLKLARLYFNSGYRKLSDIHFAIQEQLEPGSIETVINEGFRQFSRKNSQKALSIFKGALLEDPSNIRAKYGLAAVYSKQNFYSKAIQICESAIKSSPGVIPFQNELAWLNGRKKRSAGRISLSRL